ncbi:MAG: peptidase U32 family protein [Candidatus Pacearchaeota archaeon]|jgi:collagenase-like PrtC family protease
MNKIELLSPVGSLANLKAAIASGADSVYLGMNKFNAREFAINFNPDYFKEAVNLCKSNNVRLFLTMNTLIKNSEINEFFRDLSFAYKEGIDSVIIQDPSFIEIIKKSFPGLHIHMSTQAGVMNSSHANLFSDAKRIVLARELNKENLRSIRKNVQSELEIFIHGALCVCVSGSCLFSSFIGGRSGNRGKCAQPCRKRYNNCFYLSTKELCLIEQIPELIKLGIDSLKIEGRMRTPYYVATTTGIYRKAIDDYYNNHFKITPETKDKLATAFSRDFTKGCYCSENIFNQRQAQGSSDVVKQNYEVKSKIVKLEKRSPRLQLPEIKCKASKQKRLLVRVYNKKDAVLASNAGADLIYYDLFAKDFEEVKNLLKVPLYAVTPRLMFDSDLNLIEKTIKQKNPEGLLAGNMGILNLKLDKKIQIHLDYNCNCFNDYSVAYLEGLGTFPLISPELSIKEQTEFKNKNFATLVHGKLRLMTLAHLLPQGIIADEKGFKFKVSKIYNGCEILNEKELGLFNKSKNLLSSGINNFFIDTDKNVSEIVNIYRQILDGKTIDVSKIKNDYVLGWSEKGVL